LSPEFCLIADLHIRGLNAFGGGFCDIFGFFGLAKHLDKNYFGWEDGQKVGFRYGVRAGIIARSYKTSKRAYLLLIKANIFVSGFAIWS
jgi:hypothetical protein